MRDKIADDREVRKELIARAEFNEYYYKKLKESNIAGQIDEAIGIEFIDAKKTFEDEDSDASDDGE